MCMVRCPACKGRICDIIATAGGRGLCKEIAGAAVVDESLQQRKWKLLRLIKKPSELALGMKIHSVKGKSWNYGAK